MPTYPDRRSRFKNVAPWEVQAGIGRATNTSQPEPKADMAKRGLPPGEHFREVTTTKPPDPIQVVPAAPIQVDDVKMPETAKSAPPTVSTPTTIGAVLSEEG
jgi:hypothetical protein